MLPWVFLLLAIAALAVAFKTTSIGLALLCLLVALVLLVAWFLGLAARRIDSRSRDQQQMIDPMELRRLREQAEARRQAADTVPSDGPGA